MASPATTFPGYNRTPIDGAITLEELTWCGKLNLRGDPESGRFLRKAESALGLALPLEANTSNTDDSTTIYWMGPDEWLCHCGLEQKEELLADLRQALRYMHSSVVDVSDYYTVLRLGGSHCNQILARGCPLDLHPAVFPEGSSTQTRFGHASILLHKTSEIPVFDIQLRWSFAEYVWDYLAVAMDSL